MILTLLGWSLVAGLGLVMLRSREIIVSPDGSREISEHESTGHSLTRWGGIAMLTALSFYGGSAIIVASGGAKGPPAVSGTPTTPGTPAIDVIVDDTSTWRVTFSAFNGVGADTQDSISVTVLRSGAADTLFHAVSGVQTADTISDNTDLKADTTYRVLGRQKAVTGGWSDADTVQVLNVLGAAVECLFCSAWTSGTGTGATAVQDNTNAIPNGWTQRRGGSTATEVIDTAGGFGFPFDNALLTYNLDGTNAGVTFTAASNTIPVADTLVVGGSYYYRWYVRNVTPDAFTTAGGDATTHNPQTDAQNAWVIRYTSGSSGTWGFSIETVFTAVPGCPSCGAFRLGTSRTSTIGLSKDSVWMPEFRVERTDVDSVRVHARVWVVRNGVEVLKYDNDDFWSPGTSWPGGLSNVTLNDSVKFGLTSAQLTDLRSLDGVGVNGYSSGGESELPFLAHITGAFCMTADGWCEAYPTAGGN